MRNSMPNGKMSSGDIVAALARWVLGGLFLYMGMNKALHPEEFLKLVRQYDLVSNSLMLNSIAAILPWFEAFCGLLLLAGVAVRGTAVMIVLMLVPFTSLVLRRALAIAGAKGLPFCLVKFDCGCGAGEVYICNKLLENSLLVFVACALVAGWGHRLALRFSLLGTSAPALPPASQSPASTESPAPA